MERGLKLKSLTVPSKPSPKKIGLLINIIYQQLYLMMWLVDFLLWPV